MCDTTTIYGELGVCDTTTIYGEPGVCDTTTIYGEPGDTTIYGELGDFVTLAVPDSLPVLEPDSLAPPTFVLIGMTVFMIVVSRERRDCVQYKTAASEQSCKLTICCLVSSL